MTPRPVADCDVCRQLEAERSLAFWLHITNRRHTGRWLAADAALTDHHHETHETHEDPCNPPPTRTTTTT